MRENSSFISFENSKPGLIFDDSNHIDYPIKYYNIINGEGLDQPKGECSYYGFCYSGKVVINDRYIVEENMYFSVKADFKVTHQSKDSKVVLIEVYHERGKYPETKYRAVNTTGGPIEPKGRLKYIDGCTDSLLIPPVKMGDPCFNHLHFPSHIDQTPHTHPTHRIGIVAKGEGECITPFGNLPLTEGMIFVIKEWDGESVSKGLDGNMYPDGTHSFRTPIEAGMDVIAFHPDSDFGATDIDHPMINRTIVNGVAANRIESIRTK